MPPHISVNSDHQALAVGGNQLNRYRIRAMVQTDIPTVVEIDRATWHNKSWPLEQFFYSFNDPFHKCWILESTTTDYPILGYGFQYFSDDISRITNLCIHPNRRGRGLGQILLRHMINYARQSDASFVELEVLTSNIHAYRLYVKHGFTIIQFLERYYSENADAYRMQLFIHRID
jgi:ribosomal-protein-alanine N-acetyltransferase